MYKHYLTCPAPAEKVVENLNGLDNRRNDRNRRPGDAAAR